MPFLNSFSRYYCAPTCVLHIFFFTFAFRLKRNTNVSTFFRNIKRALRLYQRQAKDAFSREHFARQRQHPSVAQRSVSVEQPFTASATLQAKRHNLALAARRISAYVVMPGEVFSFWRVVGNPNTSAFQASRGLRAGKVEIERGGGLCQISGILHHLALLAGLPVMERHSHSLDLYTEQTRFCPLGSDATVSYGYLDLRFRNTLSAPIWFAFDVGEATFRATLHCAADFKPHTIVFRRTEETPYRLAAEAYDETTGQVLCRSTYKRVKA